MGQYNPPNTYRPSGYRFPEQQNGSPYGNYVPGKVGPLSAFLPNLFQGIPPAPNPAFWLDGRGAGYSDASQVILANPPIGRIFRMPQGGGILGNPWSAPSIANSPQRLTNSILVSGSATIAQGLSFPIQGCTICVAFKPRDVYAINSILMGSTPGPTNFGVIVQNIGHIFLRYGTSSFVDTGRVCDTLDDVVVAVRYNSTTVDYKVSINGVVTAGSSAIAVPALNATGIGIGITTTDAFATYSSYYGAVSQAIGYTRFLSDPERDAVFNDFVAKPSPGFNNNPLIVFEGDSIMRGLFITDRVDETAFKACNNLMPTFPSIQPINRAVSGNTIAQMTARYASQVRPLYSSLRAKNILVVSCGTNDLSAAGAGANGITTKNALWAYCDMAKADGFIIVPGTILPREGQNAAFNPARNTCNTAIRAEYVGKGYAGLYDEAAIAGMGADIDSANVVNYPDGTHPSAIGAGLLVPALQPTLSTILSS